jgi:HSP20 family protein
MAAPHPHQGIPSCSIPTARRTDPQSIVIRHLEEIIMANLTRFDPFNLNRFDPFRDVFGNIFPSTFRPLLEKMSEPQIPMNIVETDNAYLVTADLPGVRKEDIDVNIYENQLTINAELKEEKEAGTEGKPLFSERWTGKVSRSIRLPMEIDDKGAQARCADGVLHLTLPKKTSSMAKHLTVH